MPPTRRCEVDAIANSLEKEKPRPVDVDAKEFARNFMTYSMSPKAIDGAYADGVRNGTIKRDCTTRGG